MGLATQREILHVVTKPDVSWSTTAFNVLTKQYIFLTSDCQRHCWECEKKMKRKERKECHLKGWKHDCSTTLCSWGTIRDCTHPLRPRGKRGGTRTAPLCEHIMVLSSAGAPRITYHIVSSYSTIEKSEVMAFFWKGNTKDRNSTVTVEGSFQSGDYKEGHGSCAG